MMNKEMQNENHTIVETLRKSGTYIDGKYYYKI